MSDLANRSCVPCKGDTPALDAVAAAALLAELGGGWQLESGRLSKKYAFPDFATALAFVVRVGAMADEQNHHPDVHLSWGAVRLEIWTHAVGGLTESDFVFAAKADALL